MIYIPFNIRGQIPLFIYNGASFTEITNNKQKQSPGGVLQKGILKNSTKFTGKHLCKSRFFNKVAGLRPATLFKKRLWYKCFPVIFVKFLGTAFS